ncbi:MAG: SDR family oxidoreductase [Candidatus Kapaibacterium sp.]|nr:MAG: SDR family oxidoreductase [Candidatus Kapabacteria bacterium]
MHTFHTIPKEKPKVLIIGSGSKIAEALWRVCRRLPSIADWYFMTSGHSQYDNNMPPSTRCDFTNRKELKEYCLELQPNIIVNTAAYTNVDKAESERQLAWNVNVSGVENIVAVCRLVDAHLIHFSTDYVFDGVHGPYIETDMPHPLGYYAKTKLAGENACIGGNIDWTIIRTNVLYGATHLLKPDFVMWVLNKLTEKKPFGVVNDQFSNPTLIDDIAYFTNKIIHTRTKGLFHVGGADWCSRYDFAQMIAKVFKQDASLIQPITTVELHQAALRPMRGGMIPLKAEAMFGIRFSGIESGLFTMRRQLQIDGHHEWAL